MSRGLGRLQTAVLSSVMTDSSLSFGQLCWQLAEVDGRGISKEGDLRQSFYASCHRAIVRLVDEGNLQRTRRKLRSVAELLTHYPHKTRQQKVRNLRIRLLPHLSDYLGETKARHFGVAEVERFYIRQQTESTMREFGNRWRNLEDRLCVLLGEVPNDRRDIVLDLLIKGRSTFGGCSGANHPSDLGSIVRGALARTGLMEAEYSLYSSIHELYNSLFPSDKQCFMSLKDQLYTVVDMSKKSNARPYLKDRFKQELLKRDLTYIESLDGHQTGSALDELYNGGWLRPVQFSPLLNQLIGRDSLADFDFITKK